MNLTAQQEQDFLNSTHCHICNKEFTQIRDWYNDQITACSTYTEEQISWLNNQQLTQQETDYYYIQNDCLRCGS